MERDIGIPSRRRKGTKVGDAILDIFVRNVLYLLQEEKEAVEGHFIYSNRYSFAYYLLISSEVSLLLLIMAPVNKHKTLYCYISPLYF